MEHEFWQERWSRNEIGFHQQEINAHLQAFWPKGMSGKVFVPLCGKSRDMLWLREQGHEVIGVELSELAVESFFSENGLQPELLRNGGFNSWHCDGITLFQGDYFSLGAEQLEGVGMVYDRASLVALPESMREDYARHLLSILPREAQCLLVTMEYPQEQMKGPPFSVQEREVQDLFRQAWEIENRFEQDILAENPRFRERGLSRMVEKVFLLRRKP
jgi:thiopurine S-methyltransferase